MNWELPREEYPQHILTSESRTLKKSYIFDNIHPYCFQHFFPTTKQYIDEKAQILWHRSLLGGSETLEDLRPDRKHGVLLHDTTVLKSYTYKVLKLEQ